MAYEEEAARLYDASDADGVVESAEAAARKRGKADRDLATVLDDPAAVCVSPLSLQGTV